MTKNVRICLSYDLLKWDLIAFKMNIIAIRECTVDTVIVDDIITCMLQSVITCVVIHVYDMTLSTE